MDIHCDVIFVLPELSFNGYVQLQGSLPVTDYTTIQRHAAGSVVHVLYLS